MLVGDIDLSSLGTNFTALIENEFTGILDGNGYTISNLSINNAGSYTGLFAQMNGTVRNLTIENANIKGGANYTGILAGKSTGNISNVYVSGTVSGAKYVGGLVGYVSPVDTYSDYGSSPDSYITCVGANVTVTGTEDVGGLIGVLTDTMAPGYAAGVIISNAYSTGRVQGETIVGGLVGSFYGDDSVIQNTYSTSSVGATASGGVTGAVVGKYSGDGTIKNSYFAVNSSSISTGTGEYESSGVTRLTNSSEISQQAINSGWSPEIWDFTTGSTPVLKELTNTYSKSVSAGTVVINDTEINISSGSIEDAINTINAKTSETGVTAYIDDNNNLAFKSSSNFTLHAGTSNILDVACIKLSQNSNPTTIKSGINYENTGTLAGSASIITTGITEAEAIAQGYTVINTAEALQNITNNLSGRYILMNDIDLSGIDWTPIGAKENSFTGGFSGEFNGNGFTISLSLIHISEPTRH